MPDSVTFIGYQSFRCAGWGRDFKGIYFQFSNALRETSYQSFTDMGLTDVWLPDALESIGDKCFLWASLDRIHLPNNPNLKFGKGAFAISTLSYIDIPEGLVSLGYTCFSIDPGYEHVAKLKSVHLPASLQTINYGAFHNQGNLEDVIIPAGVTAIEDYAFCRCSSLCQIEIPTNVQTIGYAAFAKCPSLTSVVLGDNLLNIADYAFSDCPALTQVIIPKKVNNLGYASFYNDTSLTSVTIPSSVTTIGAWAFSDCYALENVTFEGTVE
jgi:hypothetical protein